MLEIKMEEREFYDEKFNEFHYLEPKTLCLEHSLVTMSEWESKTHKPFFVTMEKGMTTEETLDYIKIMSGNKVTNEELLALNNDNIKVIKAYIEDPMTATTFMELKKNSQINAGRKKEIITAEIIYYWMVELGIPFECENWHLNKLMTLIKVCTIKNASNTKGGKMNKRDTMAFNRALMSSRRGKAGH